MNKHWARSVPRPQICVSGFNSNCCISWQATVPYCQYRGFRFYKSCCVLQVQACPVEASDSDSGKYEWLIRRSSWVSAVDVALLYFLFEKPIAMEVRTKLTWVAKQEITENKKVHVVGIHLATYINTIPLQMCVSVVPDLPKCPACRPG